MSFTIGINKNANDGDRLSRTLRGIDSNRRRLNHCSISSQAAVAHFSMLAQGPLKYVHGRTVTLQAVNTVPLPTEKLSD